MEDQLAEFNGREGLTWREVGAAGEENAAVYKNECMYSYDTPLSETGVYVNLHTFRAYGADYLLLDQRKTGSKVYLHIKHTMVPKEDPAEAEGGDGKKEEE